MGGWVGGGGLFAWVSVCGHVCVCMCVCMCVLRGKEMRLIICVVAVTCDLR